MSILDQYRKQLEIDAANQNDLLPEGSLIKGEAEQEEYRKLLYQLRNDPHDLANQHKNAVTTESVAPISERSEMNFPKTADEDIRLFIRKAYCPKCGQEIQGRAGTYRCECDTAVRLLVTYPHLVAIDNDGKEITLGKLW